MGTEEPRARDIRRLLPHSILSDHAPMTARYLSWTLDGDGGFCPNGPTDLATLLRDVVVAIRRFAGYVRTAGSETGDGHWALREPDKVVAKSHWEDMCRGALSPLSSIDRYTIWESISGTEDAGAMVGRLKEGRGVDSVPAAISTLLRKVPFTSLPTDVEAGVILAAGLERLISLAGQIELEAELVSPPPPVAPSEATSLPAPPSPDDQPAPPVHPVLGVCPPDPATGDAADLLLDALVQARGWALTIEQLAAMGQTSASEPVVALNTFRDRILRKFPEAKLWVSVRTPGKTGRRVAALVLRPRPRMADAPDDDA